MCLWIREPDVSGAPMMQCCKGCRASPIEVLTDTRLGLALGGCVPLSCIWFYSLDCPSFYEESGLFVSGSAQLLYICTYTDEMLAKHDVMHSMK